HTKAPHEKEPNYVIISIVISIITLLFLFQRFGTSIVGRAFGPIMLVWFTMLAVLGVYQISQNFSVLHAINPVYAYNLIINKPEGFWLLGSIFLCTTGGEALYSDLGHCGRKNIRFTWGFVKTALILNYMGQGAWLIQHDGEILNSIPFYSVMPKDFIPFGIVIATSAAIIASQALITGSFTLISEAIRLNVWPKMKLVYPTLQKGQLYVPAINTLLWMGCVAVVLFFKESEKMEAAYGLSITITMLMTTILMANYLTTRRIRMIYIYLFLAIYITIEGSFLVANMKKFMDGGIFTILIGGVLVFIMYVWHRAAQIKNKLTEYDRTDKYIKNLKELSADLSVAKYATNLVFMTGSPSIDRIETKIIYSIFHRQPKRADIYWFVHVDTTDEPYTMEYKVDVLAEDDVVWVTFRLGFRVEQKINLYFRKVVEELVEKKEIDITSRYASLAKQKINGDFRFVVLEKYLSNENKLPLGEQIIMATYFFLKNYTINEKSWFGLDTSSVTVEKIPLVIQPMQEVNLKRVYH
ncbi:MAG TPA: KUP/HAK/KT family potassium transporter, partial [Cytophagales bacterium]|nr:KUP/HAK/KT family potassium transporter [Cytophagales bacterium]